MRDATTAKFCKSLCTYETLACAYLICLTARSLASNLPMCVDGAMTGLSDVRPTCVSALGRTMLPSLTTPWTIANFLFLIQLYETLRQRRQNLTQSCLIGQVPLLYNTHKVLFLARLTSVVCCARVHARICMRLTCHQGGHLHDS